MLFLSIYQFFLSFYFGFDHYFSTSCTYQSHASSGSVLACGGPGILTVWVQNKCCCPMDHIVRVMGTTQGHLLVPLPWPTGLILWSTHFIFPGINNQTPLLSLTIPLLVELPGIPRSFSLMRLIRSLLTSLFHGWPCCETKPEAEVIRMDGF